MNETRTVGKEMQDQILTTVRMSQEAVVEALQTWVSAVQSITPNLPNLPDVNMPFTDKLPKPTELIASAYDFAEQLLASQRKFAEEVIQATAPILAQEPGAAKKSAAAK